MNCCIRAKWLYSRKVVIFGQSSCIPAKVVVLGQGGCIWAKWWYSGKSGCIRTKWYYSDKVVKLGQICCILGKSGINRGKFLCLR